MRTVALIIACGVLRRQRRRWQYSGEERADGQPHRAVVRNGAAAGAVCQRLPLHQVKQDRGRGGKSCLA